MGKGGDERKVNVGNLEGGEKHRKNYEKNRFDCFMVAGRWTFSNGYGAGSAGDTLP